MKKFGSGPPAKNGVDFDIGSALELGTDMELAMQELYERLDVKKQNEDIKEQTKRFIDGMVRAKIGTTDISVASFAINMLVNVEARTLASAMKQCLYLEHIIDTLMVRIDENFGGSNGDYFTLMQLQGALLTMQQYLMQTVRQLPINIQNSVNLTLENFQIEVEAIAKDEDDNKGGIIAKTADLIENIEKIQEEVAQSNREIDEMEPEKLPEDWNISDDALMNTKTIEDARAYATKYGLAGGEGISNGELLEGQPFFPDDEFDDDDDD